MGGFCKYGLDIRTYSCNFIIIVARSGISSFFMNKKREWGYSIQECDASIKGMLYMLYAYRYSESIQDAFDSVFLFVGKKEDESELGGTDLVIDRAELEEYVNDMFNRTGEEYRVIRRKKTTSFSMKLLNPNDELEEVKLTIRYDDDDAYTGYRLVNLTFDRDLNFYIETAEDNKVEDN